MTLKSINTSCIGEDKSITFFHAEVQRENDYQFQTLNIKQCSNGMVLVREFFPIEGFEYCEAFPFSSKTQPAVYEAWTTFKRRAKAFELDKKSFDIQVVAPNGGIILGGDTSPDNIVTLYQSEETLQWNLNFGPGSETKTVTLLIDGMNHTTGKVQKEFIMALRNASKKNYDETCSKFLEMHEYVAKLVKERK